MLSSESKAFTIGSTSSEQELHWKIIMNAWQCRENCSVGYKYSQMPHYSGWLKNYFKALDTEVGKKTLKCESERPGL